MTTATAAPSTPYGATLPAPSPDAPSTPGASGSSLHDRVIVQARLVTADRGWAAVTMKGLADAVGVSRQTVYNEVGSKESLAEGLILAELDRFLHVVERAFDLHPTDLVAAIEVAIQDVLELARGNAVLHAVVSATHGADTELLPLLTTHSGSLLRVATQVLHDRLSRYDVDLDAEELDGAVDMVVRVVLSHVMQPSASPTESAASITRIAQRILAAR